MLTFFRYKAITQPLHQHTSKKTALKCFIMIWITSILLALPVALFHQYKYVVDSKKGVKPFCTPYSTFKTILKIKPNSTMIYSDKVVLSAPISYYLSYDHFMLILFLIQYAIPFIIMGIMYMYLCRLLWFREIPGNPDVLRDKAIILQKKKSVKMMLSVVVSFGLCWLPWQAFHGSQLLFPKFKRYEKADLVDTITHSYLAQIQK